MQLVRKFILSVLALSLNILSSCSITYAKDNRLGGEKCTDSVKGQESAWQNISGAALRITQYSRHLPYPMTSILPGKRSMAVCGLSTKGMSDIVAHKKCLVRSSRGSGFASTRITGKSISTSFVLISSHANGYHAHGMKSAVRAIKTI